MKIAAIFVCAAAATITVSRHARSQSLPDERGSDLRPTYYDTKPQEQLYRMLRWNLVWLYDYQWSMTESLANNMTSYGCWCQIRNQAAGGTVPGHGQPVDELDRLCHQWQQCRSCTTMDSTECDADTSNYHHYIIGTDIQGGQAVCNTYMSEYSVCVQNTCRCDEELALALAYAVNDRSIDFDTNNGFDHVKQCSSNGTGGNNSNNGNSNNGLSESTIQCCGEYPNRFPYNTKGGTTQCCGSRTYNRNQHECCENSFLTSVGGCSVY